MKNRLGVLQREQIEFGRKAGLSEEAIKVYAKSKFNFLQMQEMRLALEDGISIKEVKKRFKSKLNHDEMERLRKEIKKLEEYEDTETNENILIPYYISLGVGIFLILSYFVVSYFMISNKPYLELVNESVNIKEGEVFNPKDYVIYDDNYELSYNDISASTNEQVIIYELKKGDDKIIRYLNVNIY